MFRRFPLALLLLGVAAYAHSSDDEVELSEEAMNECLSIAVGGAGDEVTIKELRDICRDLSDEKIRQDEAVTDAVESIRTESVEGEAEDTDITGDSRLLDQRLNMEALNRGNRFLLTPHKRNYILPVSYQSGRNIQPYREADSPLVDLKNIEVEFQLSVKVLIREAIFGDNGHLYVGYTNQSFWQAYTQDISRPFRETNHQPEIMLTFINAWEIFGFRNIINEVIYNHHSNGQSGPLSRSWDRIMFNAVFERGPVAFSIRPWYRIPEDEGDGPLDPKGDDNPDIHRYMGNFELSAAYKRNDHLVDLLVRNNLRSDNNRGALQVNWSFPVSSTVRGYVKYFNGYGHSLIDHNHHTNAIGLGITFTDLF